MRPHSFFPHRASAARRGVTIVQVAIFAPIAVGFTALAVDVGLLLNAQGDLQRAADSAALAGASAYISDDGLMMNKAALKTTIEERSQAFSLQNPTLWVSTILDTQDIQAGTHSFDNPDAELYDGERWNAAEVLVRREPGSSNGAVAFFFARIFGMAEGGVTADARAIFDDHVASYQLDGDSNIFVPFTVHEDIYNDMVVNGPDDYSYNDGGNVDSSPDGIREVRLFPWTWSDEDAAVNGGSGNGSSDGNDAAGNFGILNIGIENVGTDGVAEQITSGITPEQLQAEFGVPELEFFNEAGEPVTYDATGNPGLTTSLKDELQGRVGDIVGFFLHQDSYNTGENTIFVITAIRFGRIMHVDILGPPSQRSVSIQPVAWTDGNVILDPTAPSTGGLLGKLVLVK